MDEEPKSYDSPDGAWRIVGRWQSDERGWSSGNIEVIDLRSGSILANLSDVVLEGTPEWVPAGGATLSVEVGGARFRVGIRPDHTYVLHPSEEPRPLAGLAAELRARVPAPPATTPPPAKDAIGWGTILGSLVAAAVGAWMMAAPRPGRPDRWWGLACALFFGAIALLGLWDKARRR